MRTNESNAFPAGSPGLMWHRCKIRRVLPAYRRDRDLVDLSRMSPHIKSQGTGAMLLLTGFKSITLQL